MHTCHRTLFLAGLTLHHIDFDASTLMPADLLWLPHHTQLAGFARKRQAEHLAGRIAAVHALRAWGETTAPGQGAARQPIWPAGLYGSISHSANRALAVVARQPVGVDIEGWFSPTLAAELTGSIASPAECALLEASALPFERALTLLFSAKESLYKAYSHLARPFPGFASARLTAISEGKLTLRLREEFSPQLDGKEITVCWQSDSGFVITLAHDFRE